jgi:aminopeptidase
MKTTTWMFAALALGVSAPALAAPDAGARASAVADAGQPVAMAAQTIQGLPPPQDTREIARKVVRSANIREKELVLVRGGIRDETLLDDIALEVAASGAYPLRQHFSERYTYRWWDEIPPRNDSSAASAQLKLASVVDADINVDWVDNPGYLSSILPDRLAAGRKAQRPVDEARLKRNIKIVNLGNGLYPTEALAKRFGMSRSALAQQFWGAVNVDYAKLKATGELVRQMLKKGHVLRLTNANGTDLTMRIGDRPIFVSDGVLTDDEIKKGGPACLVWLPAGEVYFAPAPVTAEGTVVFDRAFHEDREIIGLTLTFKKGKVTSMTAKSGIEGLQVHFEAAGPGKEDFAFIDLGINPHVQRQKVLSYIPAGMVTIGIGGDAWAGGTNTSEFAFEGFQPDSSVSIDGQPLIENGELKVSAFK